MSLASMTQWAFNCVIARATPNMLITLKFGTFVLFGTFTVAGCCWAAFFLPETSAWPLEKLEYAFKGNLVKRSIRDLSIKQRNRHREMVLAELSEQSDLSVTENAVPTLGVGGTSESDHVKDAKSDEKH